MERNGKMENIKSSDVRKESEKSLKCPNCDSELKEVEVNVYGAKNKVISYQCPNGDYFEFEPQTSRKVVEELRNSTKNKTKTRRDVRKR